MSKQSAVDFYIDVREMRAAQKMEPQLPETLQLKSMAEQRVDECIERTEAILKKKGQVLRRSDEK